MSPASPIRQARLPPQHVAVCAVAQPLTWTARPWPVMYIQDGKELPPVIAYADDITILLTPTSDVLKLQRVLHHYKWTTWVLINTRKSTTLRLGLQESVEMLYIQYATDGKMLSVTLHSTVDASSSQILQPEVHSIKCLTQAADHRDLCCIQHVRFIQIFLFSKIWYVAQILPIPDEVAHHITRIISWYLWWDAIFHFPLSTLSATPKQQVGSKHGCLSSSSTTHQICARTPPVSTTSEYITPNSVLCHGSSRNSEERVNAKAFTHTYVLPWDLPMTCELRKQPAINWRKVWKKLHALHTYPHWSNDFHVTQSSTQIYRTKFRLHIIRFKQTDQCPHCRSPDTLQNHLAVCKRIDMWDWIRGRIALLLRTGKWYTPSIWLTPTDVQFLL